MDKKIFLFALVAVAVVPVGAISSDAVKSIAANYLDTGEQASTLLSSPVDLNGERYWLVAFNLVNSPDNDNLFLAIDDSTSTAVNDPTILQPLLDMAGRLEVINLLKKNSLSLEDMRPFLSDSESKTNTVQQNFVQLVRQQLELKYQKLDFSPLDASLQDFTLKQQAAQQALDNSNTLLQTFDSFPSTVEFNQYYSAYNQTFGAFDQLSQSASNYQDSLLVFTQAVSNSPDLNYSDKSLINGVLEKLSDVGDYSTFKNTQLSPAESSFNALDVQSSRLLDDRVNSTLDRIAKKDAQAAFTPDIQSRVASYLNPQKEFSLSSCNIDISGVKQQWLFVKTTLALNATRDNLLQVPPAIANISSTLDQVDVSYNDCLNSPRQPPQPANTASSSVVNLLIVVLVAVLAYAGYKKYREMREEAPD